MQVIERGTFGKVLFYQIHLYFYIKVISLFLQQSRTAVDQNEADSYTKGKRQFQACKKRCKTRLQNCQQQETKGSPRASAGRVIGPPGEELPPEHLPGKKP